MPVMTFSISSTADLQKVEGAVRDTIKELTVSSAQSSEAKNAGTGKQPAGTGKRRKRGPDGAAVQKPAFSMYKTMRVGTIEAPEELVVRLKKRIDVLEGITEVVVDQKGLSVKR